MALTVIKECDGRKRGLIDDWNRWLVAADQLYMRMLNEENIYPIAQHEVSISGFLASSAALAGFLPLMEYETLKKDKNSVDGYRNGRADLWFSSGHRTYSFEIKRAFYQSNINKLKSVMNLVIKDTGFIDDNEAGYFCACVMAYVSDEKYINVFEEFSRDENVTSAYRIGPSGAGCAYIYFNIED